MTQIDEICADRETFPREWMPAIAGVKRLWTDARSGSNDPAPFPCFESVKSVPPAFRLALLTNVRDARTLLGDGSLLSLVRQAKPG
jgi:hypothetical protein